MSFPSFDQIASLLTEPCPPLQGGERAATAVALLLREGSDGLQLLYIQRAIDHRDPWSGNLAFPGGRRDTDDPSLRVTAERETWEELGLNLTNARFLGCLCPITGAHLPVEVHCFVYALEEVPPLVLSHEVASGFWYPLTELLQTHRHIQTEVSFGTERLQQPALRILGADGPVLWGITYRLTNQLLERLGHPLPPPGP